MNPYQDTEKENKLYVIQYIFVASAPTAKEAVLQSLQDFNASDAKLHVIITNATAGITKELGINKEGEIV